MQELIIAKNTKKPSQVVLIDNHSDPVILYIKSLNSDASQKQMAKLLFAFARWHLGESDVSPQNVVWSELGYQTLQDYQDHLYKFKKLEASTVNNHINAVKGVLKKSARIRTIPAHNKISLLDYEETKELKPIRSHREPKGRALSVREVENIFEICVDDSITGIRDLALTMTFIYCGLRLNELSEIIYPDCFKGENVLNVIGKGNKQRLIPLNTKVKSALTNWIEEVRGTDRGPLFCRIWRTGELNDGEQLSHSGIRYILKKRSVKAGGKSFSPHDLRRTFGTRLFEKNVDVITVQEMLGHASTDTSRKYDKRGSAAKESAVELL